MKKKLKKYRHLEKKLVKTQKKLDKTFENITKILHDKVDMEVRVKVGTKCWQDFQPCEWRDEDKVLRIIGVCGMSFYTLTAPGYGNLENYGNGAITVPVDSVEFV